MTERKGASYQITQKRAAQNPAEHAQPTQASARKLGSASFSPAWETEYERIRQVVRGQPKPNLPVRGLARFYVNESDDPEPIPHNVRAQQRYRERGY